LRLQRTAARRVVPRRRSSPAAARHVFRRGSRGRAAYGFFAIDELYRRQASIHRNYDLLLERALADRREVDSPGRPPPLALPGAINLTACAASTRTRMARTCERTRWGGLHVHVKNYVGTEGASARARRDRRPPTTRRQRQGCRRPGLKEMPGAICLGAGLARCSDCALAASSRTSTTTSPAFSGRRPRPLPTECRQDRRSVHPAERAEDRS